jgi:hypothetical protein
LWDRERIAGEVRQIDPKYKYLQTGALRKMIEQELGSAYKRVGELESKIVHLTSETDAFDSELHELEDKLAKFRRNEEPLPSAIVEGKDPYLSRGNAPGQTGPPGRGTGKSP